MKLLYTLAVLCCFSFANAQSAFKAITYNIKWNDLMVDEDTWEDRKDAMLVFFLDEKADFIGLQEVMEDQLYFLSSELEDYNAMGVGRDDGRQKGEYCPILYDSKKWKSLESKTIWLSETPDAVSKGWDAACNRIVTYGLFANLETSDTLAVFNTHLDHVGQKARRNSVELLSDFVEEKSRGLPSIILGDFNLEPNDHLYRTITDDFFDAKNKAYSVHEEHRGTYNGFRTKGSFDRRIDYVFFQGGLDVISYECPELRVFGRHVSDHFPVIVIMEFLEDE